MESQGLITDEEFGRIRVEFDWHANRNVEFSRAPIPAKAGPIEEHSICGTTTPITLSAAISRD